MLGRREDDSTRCVLRIAEDLDYALHRLTRSTEPRCVDQSCSLYWRRWQYPCSHSCDGRRYNTRCGSCSRSAVPMSRFLIRPSFASVSTLCRFAGAHGRCCTPRWTKESTLLSSPAWRNWRRVRPINGQKNTKALEDYREAVSLGQFADSMATSPNAQFFTAVAAFRAATALKGTDDCASLRDAVRYLDIASRYPFRTDVGLEPDTMRIMRGIQSDLAQARARATRACVSRIDKRPAGGRAAPKR